MTQAPVIAYFDTAKKSVLLVDGSPYGISAILAQKDQNAGEYNIIAYASRALSAVESRYSQTDIEGLALVWGVEHFPHVSPRQRIRNSDRSQSVRSNFQ